MKKDEERKPGEVNWDKVSHETLETMASLMEGFKDNLPDPKSESVQEQEVAELVEGLKGALNKARGNAWYGHVLPEERSTATQTQHTQPLKPPYITKEGMKKLGWTDAAIRQFLPNPDERKPNPYYKTAAPMQLWKRSRGEAIESSLPWYEWVAQSKQRSHSARKRASSRKQQLMDEATQLALVLKKIPPHKLRADACRHYNSRQDREDERRGTWCEMPPATLLSEPDFLDRITVNYLRHQCSSYDKSLAAIAVKVGVDDAYRIIRDRALQAIAEAYRCLSEECERQKLDE